MKHVRVLVALTALWVLAYLIWPEGANAASDRYLVGIPGIDDPEAGFNDYINAVYALAISAAAMLAVIKIIVAGVKYMLSDVVTSKEEAKKDIWGALLGLLIVLSAVLILSTINPQLTQTNVFLKKFEPEADANEDPNTLGQCEDPDEEVSACGEGPGQAPGCAPRGTSCRTSAAAVPDEINGLLEISCLPQDRGNSIGYECDEAIAACSGAGGIPNVSGTSREYIVCSPSGGDSPGEDQAPVEPGDAEGEPGAGGGPETLEQDFGSGGATGGGGGGGGVPLDTSTAPGASPAPVPTPQQQADNAVADANDGFGSFNMNEGVGDVQGVNPGDAPVGVAEEEEGGVIDTVTNAAGNAWDSVVNFFGGGDDEVEVAEPADSGSDENLDNVQGVNPGSAPVGVTTEDDSAGDSDGEIQTTENTNESDTGQPSGVLQGAPGSGPGALPNISG